MADDNVIPFPKRNDPPDFPFAFVTSTGVTITGDCNDLVHYFGSVPGSCKCGARFWNGSAPSRENYTA